MRITRKIRLAAAILAQERLADDKPQFILDLYQQRVVSRDQIYAACMHFGYRWDARKNTWYQAWPHWLEQACRNRDRKTMKGWMQ